MISREQLAKLADLYDQYQNSLLPLSQSRIESGKRFKEMLETLYATHAPDLPFDNFRRAAIEQCREYLRKNQ
jgi:hypothetical protein